MGFIGDYFHWANAHDMNSALPELFFWVVLPAVAALIAATAAIWILVGVKSMGRSFTEGYKKARRS
jgi:hypothetical protein